MQLLELQTQLVRLEKLQELVRLRKMQAATYELFPFGGLVSPDNVETQLLPEYMDTPYDDEIKHIQAGMGPNWNFNVLVLVNQCFCLQVSMQEIEDQWTPTASPGSPWERATRTPPFDSQLN